MSQNISPTVTVTIPSYNHSQFIEQAIHSVLNQTYQDFELLIVDDCSTDNTLSILEKFRTHPKITIFVNKHNMGACFGHNLMIEKAQGKYIAILNSDDYWDETKLEKQVMFLNDNCNYAAVFSDVNLIDEKGYILKGHKYNTRFDKENRSRFEWLYHFFHKGNCLCHPSVLIRKSIYNEIGHYNLLMTSLPDFDMWVRVCLKYNIYILTEKLIYFRILDGDRNVSSPTIDNSIVNHFTYKQILNHFLKLLPDEYEITFKEKVHNSVAFSLALKAISVPRKFQQDWGISLLYNQCISDATLMNCNELRQIIRSLDIYNFKTIHNLNEQINILNSQLNNILPTKVRKRSKWLNIFNRILRLSS